MISRRGILAGMSSFALLAASEHEPGPYLSPEQFGADPTGNEPSSTALIQMFESAMQSGAICKPKTRKARYRLDRTVAVQTRGRPLRLSGHGMNNTRFLIDGSFTGFSIVGTKDREAPVELRGFSISRPNSQSYIGKIGKRSIEVLRSNGVVLSKIDESGSIGFGIFLDRCSNYEISGCIVHDHVSGSAHRSGTDGIHVYRSPGPGLIFENVVHNVGDDPIAFGSFYPKEPTTDFKCYNNTIFDSSGAVKIYGNSNSFEIFNNNVDRTITGGVIIWDDRDQNESFEIYNGYIHHNHVSNQRGAGVSGGISIWAPSGNGKGQQRNIQISDNIVSNCNFGITVASQTPEKFASNIRISNNLVHNILQRGILVTRHGGDIHITGNFVEGTGHEGAYLGPAQEGRNEGRLIFENNTIRRSALADPKRHAIEVASKRWILTENSVQL